MKALLSLALATFLASTTHAAAGGYVGNGGDGIECRKDPANRFDGIYALDYLVTLPTLVGDDGLSPVASWSTSETRIKKLLRKNVPSLAQSFEHFAGLIYNTSYAEDRVWESSPFGLMKLDDQRLTSLIPANCKKGADPMVMQAVIRLYEGYSGTRPGHFVYKYDPNLLAQISGQDPLQLSFLFVHEWLWDISPNVERNRRVNRFLHSKEIETLSPAEVVAELTGMGLQIPTIQPSEFDESSCQGYPLTEKELLDYYPHDDLLANFGKLTISRRDRAVNCDPHIPDCDLGWKKARPTHFPFDLYEFFLSPSWAHRNKSRPIQLMSPGNHAAERRPLMRGSGEIQCEYVNDPVYNLKCYASTDNLNAGLFGERFFGEMDFTKLPAIKAKLTQECFWMKSLGNRDIRSYGPHPGQQGLQRFESEMVLTVRASKGVFLEPRP